MNAAAAIAVIYLLYALISRRMGSGLVTPPMLFAVCGVLLGAAGLGWLDPAHGDTWIHYLAEITLIIVLFIDAASMDIRRLLKDHRLPLRTLLIGMPLVIILGMLAAMGLFPDFSLWQAALLAAILAPTDAALGQSVVSDEQVPERVRQTITVESGLNDGIALPFVLVFAALALGDGDQSAGHWSGFAGKQVVFGPLAGIAVGWAGAWLLNLAESRAAMPRRGQAIAALALAALAYVAAELIGGNGFISAFVAGLALSYWLDHECEFLYEFAEAEGHLLTTATFLLFGAVMMDELIEGFQWVYLLYALLSLTVIRMLPMALSLIGSGVRLRTVFFIGWFGPRGLASVLFALLVVERYHLAEDHPILLIITCTVALSILLHGLTASPFSRWYANYCEREETGVEDQPVAPLRVARR